MVQRVFELLDGRKLTGLLMGGRDEFVRLGVVPGSTVYADSSFLSIVDETMLSPDVVVWPLTIADCAPSGDAHVVRAVYLSTDEAVTALKLRHLKGKEDRSPLLTKINAVEKWSRR